MLGLYERNYYMGYFPPYFSLSELHVYPDKTNLGRLCEPDAHGHWGALGHWGEEPDSHDFISTHHKTAFLDENHALGGPYLPILKRPISG